MAREEEMVAQADLDECPPWVNPLPIPAGVDLKNLAKWVGFEVRGKPPAKVTYHFPDWYSKIWDNTPYPIDRLIVGIIVQLINFYGVLGDKLAKWLGCDLGKAGLAVLGKQVLGLGHRWLGVNVQPMNSLFDQQIAYACPGQIMSMGEANACFLVGQMSYETWKCYVQANDFPEWVAAPIVFAGRQRPNANDLRIVYNRGALPEADFREGMAGNGWLIKEEVDTWHIAQDQWPTVSDIITFMLKDVADDDIVDRFGLADEFDKKYQGRIKDYAKGEQVPEGILLDHWKAHWQNIAPGQLYEMYHRLADWREEVDPELQVSEDDVLAALGQDDYPTFWRKRLLAISYRPLTRVDTQRAFYLGAIEERDVLNSYLDEGYDKENAQRMTDFTVLLKRQWVRGHAGAQSPTAVADGYANNLYGRDEAVMRMREIGYSDDVTDLALTAAARRYRDKRAKALITATASAFKRGGLSVNQAYANLVSTGMDPTQANGLITEWESYLKVKDKDPTVAVLCRWAVAGWISPENYVDRLRKLGYSYEEASKLAAGCKIDGAIKYAKEQAKLAAKKGDCKSADNWFNQQLTLWTQGGMQGPPPSPPPCKTSEPATMPTLQMTAVNPCTGKPIDLATEPIPVCADTPDEGEK